MGSAAVRKTAVVLDILVLITFVCNLTALPLAPALVHWRYNPTFFAAKQSLGASPLSFWLEGLSKVWSEPRTAALALFLLFSGACTAVILWQARRVLKTILRGRPFSAENAASLNRAAVCAFLIAAAALVRVIVSVRLYRSVRPLLTYNALFIAVFSIAGLLCLVMAALFRQSAELKAENDLII